jgi:hypothetical protein
MESDKTSPLLNLPAELQILIYELVLTQNGNGCPNIQEITQHHRQSGYRPSGILLVNKQVHSEATPIFYKATAFLLSSERLDFVDFTLPRSRTRPDLVGWIRKIPTQYRGLIKCIRLRVWTRSIEESKQMLQWYKTGTATQGLELKDGVVWLMLGMGDHTVWINELGSQERERND